MLAKCKVMVSHRERLMRTKGFQMKWNIGCKTDFYNEF